MSQNNVFKLCILTMPLNKKCFCGTTKSFSACCQPFINKEKLPQTPEQLMRSRFSAYATGNGQYIYDTYAKSSQVSQSVKELNEWSEACKWIALQIHSINNNDVIENESAEQFVEFSAFYIADGVLCELRENSRFVFETPLFESTLKNDKRELEWRYIDGDIVKHDELATIKRKELCPCNNFPTTWVMKKGKKYKQCCG